MLLSTLLTEHPGAVIDIVRRTPPWVGGVLLLLLALGLRATRARSASRSGVLLLLLPLAMAAWALASLATAFGASGHWAGLLGAWALSGLAVFVLKYSVSVQLALAPGLARVPGFATGVAALYGALSGLFAARTWRVLRTARAAAA